MSAKNNKGSYANQNPMTCIDSFVGNYRFLSNFYQCSVEYDGITYDNSEAAFQAQKCKDPDDRERFVGLNPSQAKRLGRKIQLRDDWELVKDSIMYEVVLAKFKQHYDLRTKLLNTGFATLVEGNDWGDRYWGKVNNVGENRLGEILMRVREAFGGCGPMDDDPMPLLDLNN